MEALDRFLRIVMADDDDSVSEEDASAASFNDCPICQTPVEEEVLIRNTCGHLWHRQCLNDSLQHALQHRVNWPAKCCAYGNLDISSVFKYIEEDVLSLLKEREEEYSTPKPTYCQRCSTFISTRGLHGLRARCDDCGIEVCVRCGGTHSMHDTAGKCPDPLSSEDRALVSESGWRHCPICNALIERVDGCNQMTCNQCRTDFCYECGQERGVTSQCNCPQFPFMRQHQQQAQEEDRTTEDDTEHFFGGGMNQIRTPAEDDRVMDDIIAHLGADTTRARPLAEENRLRANAFVPYRGGMNRARPLAEQTPVIMRVPPGLAPSPRIQPPNREQNSMRLARELQEISESLRPRHANDPLPQIRRSIQRPTHEGHNGPLLDAAWELLFNTPEDPIITNPEEAMREVERVRRRNRRLARENAEVQARAQRRDQVVHERRDRRQSDRRQTGR